MRGLEIEQGLIVPHPSRERVKKTKRQNVRAMELLALIPLSVAREISLFLLPFQVEKVSELEQLLRAYPLVYLSVALHSYNNKEDAAAMARMLRRATNTVFDLTLYGRSRVLDIKLAAEMLRAENVESVSIQHLNLPTENVFRLLPHLIHSRNAAHTLQFVFDKNLCPGLVRAGVALFAAHLLENDASLLHLDLTRSGVALPGTTLLRCKFLESLQSAKSLCYLRLRDVGLDTYGAILLGKVLARQNTVELLDVSENILRDEGAKAIADSLRYNTRLKCVILSLVAMTGHGGCELAEALCVNVTLERLYLKDDSLGAGCGQAFASMLIVNTTLQRLYLDYCDFGPEGCKPFVDAIQSNRTLRHLRLNYNGIAVKDKERLCAEAQIGGVLEVLELADKNELGTRKPLAKYSQDGAQHSFATNYARHLNGRNTTCSFTNSTPWTKDPVAAL